MLEVVRAINKLHFITNGHSTEATFDTHAWENWPPLTALIGWKTR